MATVTEPPEQFPTGWKNVDRLRKRKASEMDSTVPTKGWQQLLDKTRVDSTGRRYTVGTDEVNPRPSRQSYHFKPPSQVTDPPVRSRRSVLATIDMSTTQQALRTISVNGDAARPADYKDPIARHGLRSRAPKVEPESNFVNPISKHNFTTAAANLKLNSADFVLPSRLRSRSTEPQPKPAATAESELPATPRTRKSRAQQVPTPGSRRSARLQASHSDVSPELQQKPNPEAKPKAESKAKRESTPVSKEKTNPFSIFDVPKSPEKTREPSSPQSDKELKRKAGTTLTNFKNPPQVKKAKARTNQTSFKNPLQNKKANTVQRVGRPVRQEPAFVDPLSKYAYQDNDFEMSKEFSAHLAAGDIIDPSTLESPGRTRCPQCEEDVSSKRLKRFMKDRPKNATSYSEFCRDHRQVTARKRWTDLGLPDIDWAGLETRIEAYYDDLREILQSKDSYYRTQLEHALREKGAQSMFQLQGTDQFYQLTPGYYGPKGADIMTEAICRDLAPEIHAATNEDDVVANCSGSNAGYVQVVLVKELAVRLIMEDLDEDVEEAREIMYDSIWLGDLLNST